VTTVTVRLSDHQLNELADRISQRLQRNHATQQPPRRLEDAQTVARALGVSRDTVYEHAEMLGGRRIGSGPRGRLRFDLEGALERWTYRSSRRDPADRKPGTATGNTRSGRQHRPRSAARLLPVRGEPIDLAADAGT
jgi:hypothetical protein